MQIKWSQGQVLRSVLEACSTPQSLFSFYGYLRDIANNFAYCLLPNLGHRIRKKCSPVK